MSASRSPQCRAKQSRASIAAWADPVTGRRMAAAISAYRTVQFTAEMDETIRTMRAAGATWKKIARRVGVCDAVLMRRVDALGLPRKLP